MSASNLIQSHFKNIETKVSKNCYQGYNYRKFINYHRRQQQPVWHMGVRHLLNSQNELVLGEVAVVVEVEVVVVVVVEEAMVVQKDHNRH